jgi:hypothetical protein
LDIPVGLKIVEENAGWLTGLKPPNTPWLNSQYWGCLNILICSSLLKILVVLSSDPGIALFALNFVRYFFLVIISQFLIYNKDCLVQTLVNFLIQFLNEH